MSIKHTVIGHPGPVGNVEKPHILKTNAVELEHRLHKDLGLGGGGGGGGGGGREISTGPLSNPPPFPPTYFRILTVWGGGGGGGRDFHGAPVKPSSLPPNLFPYPHSLLGSVANSGVKSSIIT